MAKKSSYTVSLTLPNGKRKYYRGKTKKEAIAKRDLDAALVGKGVDVNVNPYFRDVAEMWFKLTKSGPDLHTRSKETLQGTLTRYIYPALGDKRIRDLRPVDILGLMKSVENMSNSTQKKVLQATKAICSFAVDNGLIAKSPVLASIKAGGAAPEEVTPLTDDQCRQLLSAIAGTRAYLFVKLLLCTGLRKGEALALMWKDIDFRKGVIHVERSLIYPLNNKAGEINTDLKTAASRRTVPVGRDLLADLKAAKDQSSSVYVFSMANGKFLSESSFRRMWGLISYRSVSTATKDSVLERTLDFDVHPHQLRHTYITRCIENGLSVKEVQYLAGHASPDVTMRIYAHYRQKQQFEETAAKIAGFSEKFAMEG